MTWAIFVSWTPPFAHQWRIFLLRMFGAKISSRCRVYGSARIWYPPYLSIGDYSVIGPHVICYCQDRVEIGRFVTVSQGAHLVAGSHDIDDENFQLITKPIVLSDHVWVAAEAFVGPGVTAGEGAVLGACAVTFKDLPPWTVSVGNPCKIIRERKKTKVVG